MKNSDYLQLSSGQKGLVIYIHGFLDSPQVWSGVAQGLQDLDLQQVAVSYPTIPTAVENLSSADTLSQYADHMVELLAKILNDSGMPIFLVGHSMGGQVAELIAERLTSKQFASKHSISKQATDRLKGMVLITPAPLQGYPLTDEQLAGFEQRAVETDREVLRAGRIALSYDLDEQALDLLVESALNTPDKQSLQGLNAWVGGHPKGDNQSSIAVPVKVLAADHDNFFTEALLRDQVASRFAKAEFDSLSNAGHWAHIENASETAAKIKQFIQECGL